MPESESEVRVRLRSRRPIDASRVDDLLRALAAPWRSGSMMSHLRTQMKCGAHAVASALFAAQRGGLLSLFPDAPGPATRFCELTEAGLARQSELLEARGRGA